MVKTARTDAFPVQSTLPALQYRSGSKPHRHRSERRCPPVRPAVPAAHPTDPADRRYRLQKHRARLLGIVQIQFQIIGDGEQLLRDFCTGYSCPRHCLHILLKRPFQIYCAVIAYGNKRDQRQVNVQLVWLYVNGKVAAGAVLCLNDLIAVYLRGRSAGFRMLWLAGEAKKDITIKYPSEPST